MYIIDRRSAWTLARAGADGVAAVCQPDRRQTAWPGFASLFHVCLVLIVNGRHIFDASRGEGWPYFDSNVVALWWWSMLIYVIGK